VPSDVTAPLLKTFESNGKRLLPIIRAAFTSDDFIRF
jgi:hypothetical protein